MQGRTAALRKRLKDVAEFVFVDGPHQLPPLIKAPAHEPENAGCSEAGLPAGPSAASSMGGPVEPALAPQQSAPKRGWLLVPEQYASLNTKQTAAQQRQQEELQVQQEEQQQEQPQQQAQCMDEWQFSRQTAGWQESWSSLQGVLAAQGPFDGVLGFSQGAAVAAALCALQEEELLGAAQRAGCSAGAGQGVSSSAGAEQGVSSLAGPAPPAPWFKFAVICSGYVSPVPEHAALLERCRQRGGIHLPSVHIFGTGE